MSQPASAELIFVGGPVLGTDGRPRYDLAVAVADGVITAVGPEDELRSLVASHTEVVDLDGRLLHPGFQDAHAHPVQGGLERLACDLSDLPADIDAYLERIAAFAADRADDEWISGGGWALGAFAGVEAPAALLDRIVPDRPVFLVNRDHHGAWANSHALHLAGIDRLTPDPANGQVDRTADGVPSGLLHEAAMDLVGRLLPARTLADQLAGLLVAQDYLHSLGVTAWQDAIVGDYAGHEDALPAYVEAARTGRLTARVVGALWWDRTRGLEQIEELRARRALGQVGRFRATSIKIMQDGIVETQTAAMLEPYLDLRGGQTAQTGPSFVEPAQLARAVTALDADGFQVHFHALGDRAVREALDAVAAARTANGSRGNRHHLAHLQVVHPDDIPRFRELDAVANLQPLWACHEPQMDELNVPLLGAVRARQQYPFASLHRSGARLALGSDWPVSSPDPWRGIHVAVNRILADTPDEPPFLPEEALDLATALVAYTSGSAYVNGLDDTGRVAPGYRADLAVSSRDPFAGPITEIAQTRVDLTFIDGRLVFER